MNLKRFAKKPVLGILRGAQLDQIEPLVKIAMQAGLEALEITMNTPHASRLIAKAVTSATTLSSTSKKAGSTHPIMLGAGTVTTLSSLKDALAAGATFIVMPTIEKEVIKYCARRGIPVFPGALTPNEIFQAWNLGATMVKIFPAKFFGPQYFKEIKGPFNQIKLLACGGVTPQNMQDYFNCGADAISFGASVFKPQWLAAKNFGAIKKSIMQFTQRS
jgi:2-dehydro-3-deoxyphosphogluconate aldolase/(4S)-4-hydroxy-2-oxoglutarate aldolase